jgi:hypothetical protein
LSCKKSQYVASQKNDCNFWLQLKNLETKKPEIWAKGETSSNGQSRPNNVTVDLGPVLVTLSKLFSGARYTVLFGIRTPIIICVLVHYFIS